MCRFTHQLAAIGYHELAGFWQPASSKDDAAEPSGSILEPSVGRDCGIGSICWPWPRTVRIRRHNKNLD